MDGQENLDAFQRWRDRSTPNTKLTRLRTTFTVNQNTSPSNPANQIIYWERKQWHGNGINWNVQHEVMELPRIFAIVGSKAGSGERNWHPWWHSWQCLATFGKSKGQQSSTSHRQMRFPSTYHCYKGTVFFNWDPAPLSLLDNSNIFSLWLALQHFCHGTSLKGIIIPFYHSLSVELIAIIWLIKIKIDSISITIPIVFLFIVVVLILFMTVAMVTSKSKSDIRKFSQRGRRCPQVASKTQSK